METENSESSQIRDDSMDTPLRTSTCVQSYGRSSCEWSAGAGAGSRDAKERQASINKLTIAVALCLVFMIVEVFGGIKANSLAILTDAAHLLSDVAAFAISLFSIWASGWEATPRQSFGFYRIEILGALVSIQIIWLLTGILIYEAIMRLLHGSGEVQGAIMFGVAAFGLLVNIVMAFLLGHDHGGHGHGQGHGHGDHGHDHDHDDDDHEHEHEHEHPVEHGDSHTITIITTEHSDGKHEEHLEPLLAESSRKAKKPRNINVHSAYLHVLGDSIQSFGVMVGGAIIWYKPEWKVIDLACTLFFAVIVLMTTIKMLRDILEVLMESTPREIDPTKVETSLCAIQGVDAVHELHIWAITVGKVLLACHVTITPDANAELVLDELRKFIRNEYNISHVTIQIERL